MNRINTILNTTQYYEIIDRLNIIQTLIDNFLIQHPVCKINNDLSKKIENAVSSLIEAKLESHKLLDEHTLNLNLNLNDDLIKPMNDILVNAINNKPNKKRF
jgi:hypothetical protein